MTDLSKTLDCLHHELLIAKFDAYCFELKWLKLIALYISNRKQSIQSKRKKIGIPQE